MKKNNTDPLPAPGNQPFFGCDFAGFRKRVYHQQRYEFW